MKALFEWRFSSPVEKEGVIVASDLNQEWLLPWWWTRYQKHNRHPVAFVDLGLSEKTRDWCKEKGMYLPLRDLPEDFVQDFHEFDPQSLILLRQTPLGKQYWDSRSAWLRKPFACLESPFQKSIWIDLDCEILGSIGPLFDYASTLPGLGLSYDQNEAGYNSGVIAFHHGQEKMVQWAERTFQSNGQFRSDQDILNDLVKESLIHEIPPLYNWTDYEQQSSDAVILHWHGIRGKLIIQEQLMWGDCRGK